MPVAIKAFSFQYCGPFSNLATLRLGEPLTILTGKNDVGKSSILKFIDASLNNETIQRNDVNRRRAITSNIPTATDGDVICEVEYTDDSGKNKKARYTLSTAGRWKQVGTNRNIESPAVCINLTDPLKIRSTFPLDSANETEHNFISLGMGTRFSASTFSEKDEGFRTSVMRDVEETLNTKLKQLLPDTEYEFRPILFGDNEIRIDIMDSRGATEIGKRGTGTQKIFQLLANLLLVPARTNSPIVILIDEAETSLHADAQRHLRDFLFKLATIPNLTIIYSTHSPVMINALYPECVRVVLPGIENASPVIKAKSFGNNMALVRQELGMNPADSLLFADTTLVVAGPSEYLTIRKILQFLPEIFDDEISDEDVMQVNNAICVHNGEGDSIPAVCKLIKSYCATPVVLFDGDKQKVTLDGGIAKTILPAGLEIEDVIPIDKYMAGVKEACELGDALETLVEQYDCWLSDKEGADPHFKKRLTSKKVDLWLFENHDRSLKKPMAFLKAIENCEATDIVCNKPFKELFQQLKESLSL